MKLKAKRSSYGAFGNVARGQIVTVEDDAEAKKLIKTGLYSEYDKAAEEEEERERAEAAARTQHLVVKLDPSALQAEIERAMEQIDAARAAHLDLTEQLETKSQAIRELREQLEEQDETLATIPALNDELAKAKADLVARDAAIGKLESEIAALTKTDGEADTAKKTRAKKDD